MRKLGAPKTYRGEDFYWVYDDNERKAVRYVEWLLDSGRTGYVFPKAHGNALRERARRTVSVGVCFSRVQTVRLEEYTGKSENIGG